MGQHKGCKKTGGRQKGGQNRITVAAKEILANIIDENVDKAKEMLNKIEEPDKWIAMFLKMAEYVIPKQAAVSVTAGGNKADLKSELSQMAEEEIE